MQERKRQARTNGRLCFGHHATRHSRDTSYLLAKVSVCVASHHVQKTTMTFGHEATVHLRDTSYLLAKVIVNVALPHVQETTIDPSNRKTTAIDRKYVWT